MKSSEEMQTPRPKGPHLNLFKLIRNSTWIADLATLLILDPGKENELILSFQLERFIVYRCKSKSYILPQYIHLPSADTQGNCSCSELAWWISYSKPISWIKLPSCGLQSCKPCSSFLDLYELAEPWERSFNLSGPSYMGESRQLKLWASIAAKPSLWLKRAS